MPRTSLHAGSLSEEGGTIQAASAISSDEVGLVRERLPRTVVVACAVGALLVICACMLFFLQSDVLYNAFVANQVALGHPDVYRYFGRTPPLRRFDTVMPPLYYLTAGLYQKALLLTGIDPVTTKPKHIFQELYGVRHGSLFMLGLFVLKIPNLIAATLGTVLMWRLAQSRDLDRLTSAAIWIGSPAMIVTSFMQAQNDVIAVTLTVAALLAVNRRRLLVGMLLLGLAAAFKSYALLLLPVTVLVLSGRSVREMLKLSAAALAIPAVTELPFLGHDFITRVFLAHDAGSLLTPTANGRQPLQLWLMAYGATILYAWLRSGPEGAAWRSGPNSWHQQLSVSWRRRLGAPASVDLLASLWIVTLTTIFVFSYWFPQWTLWLLPMIALLAARDRLLLWLWVGLTAVLLANNFLDFPGNMDGGMLAPLFGQGPGPLKGVHVYVYHLEVLRHLVPGWVRNLVYTLCIVGFGSVGLRALHLSRGESQHPVRETGATELRPLATSLLLPSLLVPYVAVMVVQHLAWRVA